MQPGISSLEQVKPAAAPRFGARAPSSRPGAPVDSRESRGRELAEHLESLLGVPFTEGNRVDVLENGVEIFPAMLSAIQASRASIDLLTFVYWTGDIAVRFAEALAERAAAGVRVRVLLDGFGAHSMDRDLVRMMRDAGADVRWFRPLSWWPWSNIRRTHRKVMICDSRVGFTGGVGIAQEWEGNADSEDNWPDTHFRILGPAVAGLHAAFIGDWIEEGLRWDPCEEEPIVTEPAGPSSIQVIRATSSYGWSDIATLHRAALALARRSLRISAAYFVPDEASIDLMRRAVERGVEVEVITVGEHNDSQLSRMAGDDVIEALIDAGVKLYRFAPTMMHAKVVLIDDALALVGSANFNQRSMRLDDEITLSVVDRAVVDRLKGSFERDRGRCYRLTRDNWRRRPWWRRLTERVARSWRRHV